MNSLYKAIACLVLFMPLGSTSLAGITTPNQTDDLSPIHTQAELPFRIVIEKASFKLPEGVHSGVFGTYKGLWVLLAGSHIGMHGFGSNPFPAEAQNSTIYVVNPTTGATWSRSLKDPGSGLTQQQIDTLSTISPQGYQESNTLYISGGYGLDTLTGTFSTKPVLSALYLPGIIQWVTETNNTNNSVSKNLRQISNPIFQITGGEMYRLGNYTQLIFGQNFTGVYSPGSTGNYSEQIRQFRIIDNGGQLGVEIIHPRPAIPNPNFHRRDLNIVPVLLNNNNQLQYGLVAYAGVFTLDNGAWTVPVVIKETGDPIMANPVLPSTFKQGMNQYTSATVGLYSRKYESMYTLFLGGISYGFYVNGVFQTDSELPFINQVTTVKLDKQGHFTQYLMNNQYPVIPSTGSNPGNPLLFGAGAYFINNNVKQYPNSVISLDTIRNETLIGYIVGGIQSTVPNTNVITDSTASAYVFQVKLVPTK